MNNVNHVMASSLSSSHSEEPAASSPCSSFSPSIIAVTAASQAPKKIKEYLIKEKEKELIVNKSIEEQQNSNNDPIVASCDSSLSL